MNKIYLQPNKATKRLAAIKDETENLRLLRRELMARLSVIGFSNAKIAEIYGCSRQYVEQEISAYNERQTEKIVIVEDEDHVRKLLNKVKGRK